MTVGWVPGSGWVRRYLPVSWLGEVGNGLTNAVLGPMQPFLAHNVGTGDVHSCGCVADCDGDVRYRHHQPGVERGEPGLHGGLPPGGRHLHPVAAHTAGQGRALHSQLNSGHLMPIPVECDSR